MLRTKCILDPIEKDDGVRISIMSKHKWKPGIVPDTDLTEIASQRDNLWKKQFAPSQKLIGDYYKRGLSWEILEKKYLTSLETIYNEVIKLPKEALKKNITLLCLKETPEKCHRRLFAEKCKKINPKLEIFIK